jgi:hypothetical protein
MDTHNDNVSWNDRIENAAKDIGESSKGYKLLHIREAQRAVKMYSFLMYIGILVGPLSGVLSGIEAALRPPKDDPTMSVIVIFLGFLSGIIVATIKFGRYDELSNANKTAAASYTSLEANVRRQLGLYRNDRVNAIKYMEWLETKYEELFMSAPLLPAGSYKKIEEDSAIIPNRYESKININETYEREKYLEICNATEIEINDNLDLDLELGLTDKTDSPRPSPETKSLKGGKKIKRTNTMSKIPQLNKFSDKMLEYEMKRMMGL